MDNLAHIVVLEELSPRSKGQYTRFILENNIQFTKRSCDGKYVANIRLDTIENQVNQTYLTKRSIDADKFNHNTEVNNSIGNEQLLIPIELQDFISLIKQLSDKSMLNKITERDPVLPKSEESKLLQLINDIYDAYWHEYQIIEEHEEEDSEKHYTKELIFADYIMKFISNRYGLKVIVEKKIWRLIQGLMVFRKHTYAKLFCQFISGAYNMETLLIFLAARQETSVVLGKTTCKNSQSSRGKNARSLNQKSMKQKQMQTIHFSNPLKLPSNIISTSQARSIAENVFQVKKFPLNTQIIELMNWTVNEEKKFIESAIQVEEFLAQVAYGYDKLSHEVQSSNSSLAMGTYQVATEPIIDETPNILNLKMKESPSNTIDNIVQNCKEQMIAELINGENKSQNIDNQCVIEDRIASLLERVKHRQWISKGHENLTI